MRGRITQPLYRPVSAAIGRDSPIRRKLTAHPRHSRGDHFPPRFARRLLQRKVDHDTGKQTDVGTLLADHLHHGMRRPPDDRTTTAGQRRTSDYVAHLPVGGAAGRAGLGNVFPVKPTPNELLLGCVERHRSNCLHLQIQFVWATVMRGHHILLQTPLSFISIYSSRPRDERNTPIGPRVSHRITAHPLMCVWHFSSGPLAAAHPRQLWTADLTIRKRRANRRASRIVQGPA